MMISISLKKSRYCNKLQEPETVKFPLTFPNSLSSNPCRFEIKENILVEPLCSFCTQLAEGSGGGEGGDDLPKNNIFIKFERFVLIFEKPSSSLGTLS